MNPSDSKKLEEIKEWWKLRANPDDATYWAVTWLLFKAEEQDREIERLRDSQSGMEVARLIMERDYQRRHRRWALKEAHNWYYSTKKYVRLLEKAEARIAEQDREIERLQNYQNETAQDRDGWQERAGKTGAELARIREANRGMLDIMNELQAELSACKERVRELAEALKTAHHWLKEITTYPVAMQALGKITKDRIDGAIYVTEQALQAQEQSKEKV